MERKNQAAVISLPPRPPKVAANDTGEKKYLKQYQKLTQAEYVYNAFGWTLAMEEEGVPIRA